jgi:hypothetical protein
MHQGPRNVNFPAGTTNNCKSCCWPLKQSQILAEQTTNDLSGKSYDVIIGQVTTVPTAYGRMLHRKGNKQV